MFLRAEHEKKTLVPPDSREIEAAVLRGSNERERRRRRLPAAPSRPAVSTERSSGRLALIFLGAGGSAGVDISALFVKSHTRRSAEDGPLVIEINRLIIDRRQDGERGRRGCGPALESRTHAHTQTQTHT